MDFEKSQFDVSHQGIPHISRRKMILNKYPHIKELYGYNPLSKYTIFLKVLLQFFLMAYFRDKSWYSIVVFAYFLGGTISHSLFLGSHEISHNLVCKTAAGNTFMGFVANLCVPVAYSLYGNSTPINLNHSPPPRTFKKYHIRHHSYQGIPKYDMDLPTVLEGKIFRGPVGKFLFLLFQPLIYSLRPILVCPMKITNLEILQWIICIAIDIIIYKFFGIKSIAYLAMSVFFGSSLHPMAGHFVSEHYKWAPGYETYSYYGPLNLIAYNVGYHNEHHDFPCIPSNHLPTLKKMAPEFYDIPHHTSWIYTMYQFVFNPDIKVFSRVIRPLDTLSQ